MTSETLSITSSRRFLVLRGGILHVPFNPTYALGKKQVDPVSSIMAQIKTVDFASLML